MYVVNFMEVCYRFTPKIVWGPEFQTLILTAMKKISKNAMNHYCAMQIQVCTASLRLCSSKLNIDCNGQIILKSS